MKTKTILILCGIAMTLLFGYCSVKDTYNTMVNYGEDVNGQWGNVQVSYQRRSDLIPNLVSTVSSEAKFEKSTLEAVINARAKATSINIDPSNCTPDQLAAFQQNQTGLSQALGRLMVVSEQYPQLRANEAFKELRAQLEGTENRISKERNRYNDLVKDKNKYIKKFPKNIWASAFGVTESPYFQADETAKYVPRVNL